MRGSNTEDLRELIIQNYNSVYQFEKQVGFSHSTFGRILKDGIETTSVANFMKICQALGLTPNDILCEGLDAATTIIARNQMEKTLLVKFRESSEETKKIIERILT